MDVWSLLIGPPDAPSVAGWCFVRSGEMPVQSFPLFVLLNTTFEPTYSTFGSCGEFMIGNVHWKRYFESAASWPMGLSGQGSRRARSPVAWFWLSITPE